MNYESFVEHVKELIKDNLPEGWKSATVKVRVADKINQQRIGLEFNKGEKYSPTIYMEEFYEHYQHGMNLEEVIEKLQEVLGETHLVEDMKVTRETLEEKTDRIVFQLINTQSNEALLNKMPHREFHDLSIVYLYFLTQDANGLMTIPIENSLAELFDLSEETLFELAYENTKSILPIEARAMDEVIVELIYGHGVEMEREDISEKSGAMYVFTNTEKTFGAAAMLYPEEFDKVANIYEDDLYIIPSSRHEVITLPKSACNLEGVLEMVEMTNETQRSMEDALSHQVYMYDRSTREITQVTNVPNRPFCEEQREPNKEEVKERNISR